jgi:cytidyltransferase-like protein
MRVVIVTGGFDPLHSGHISYLHAARELGDILVVGVNSDSWLETKKARPFMSYEERSYIVESLGCVSEVVAFNDQDNSAIKCIEKVKSKYPQDTIIFANGGDRTPKNIPEMVVSGIEFKFGVGGYAKANSSSRLLEDWKAPKTNRVWGFYRTLHESGAEVKVKELVVEPGRTLSMQRHEFRSELWFVDSGIATVILRGSKYGPLPVKKVKKHEQIQIPTGSWHQLCNKEDIPLKLIEIQYGTRCTEADIERKVTETQWIPSHP